ncbi:MAG: hypothetical protein Q8M91_10100 [Polaromonas sp.]|nr:hypothetical protein [Polaromonas sp.]MDP3170682.1 hypothetical protein [Polaromonas sp.]MDP3606637.1 hypothetical protein [Polaromonas sp.]
MNDRNVRNPHQEFLRWGVEAGVIGLVLLCNFLLALGWYTRAPVETAVREATT